MLWLLAAAAASNPAPVPPPRTPQVVAQATATVRIISGVKLNLETGTTDGVPAAHDSSIAADGQRQPARLIEFE